MDDNESDDGVLTVVVGEERTETPMHGPRADTHWEIDGVCAAAVDAARAAYREQHAEQHPEQRADQRAEGHHPQCLPDAPLQLRGRSHDVGEGLRKILSHARSPRP